MSDRASRSILAVACGLLLIGFAGMLRRRSPGTATGASQPGASGTEVRHEPYAVRGLSRRGAAEAGGSGRSRPPRTGAGQRPWELPDPAGTAGPSPGPAFPTRDSEGVEPLEPAAASEREDLGAVLTDFLRRHQGGRWHGLYEFGGVLADLEDGDFRTVLDVLATVDSMPERRRLIEGYLFTLAQTDPGLALDFAGAVPSYMAIQSTRTHSSSLNADFSYRSLLQGWATVDLAGAVGWAESLAPGQLQSVALKTLAQEWTAHDPLGALAWAETLASSGRGHAALTTVATHWAAADLRAAVQQYERLPAGELRDVFLQGIAASWARVDPGAALGAIAGVESSALRQAGLRAALASWAQADPRAAAMWADQSLTGNDRTVLRALIPTWVGQDADAAIRFVRTLTDRTLRDQVTGIAASILVRDDPQAALALLQEIEDVTRRENIRESLVSGWARRDPAAAASWAVAAMSGAARSVAFSNVMLQWGQRDPGAALAWVADLPPDTARNSAVVALAASMQTFTEPEAASQWRQMMRRPDLAAATAAAWVRSAELPPDMRQNLLDLL